MTKLKAFFIVFKGFLMKQITFFWKVRARLSTNPVAWSNTLKSKPFVGKVLRETCTFREKIVP